MPMRARCNALWAERCSPAAWRKKSVFQPLWRCIMWRRTRSQPGREEARGVVCCRPPWRPWCARRHVRSLLVSDGTWRRGRPALRRPSPGSLACWRGCSVTAASRLFADWCCSRKVLRAAQRDRSWRFCRAGPPDRSRRFCRAARPDQSWRFRRRRNRCVLRV